ncbi:hypothetical protein ACWA7J_17570 [Leptothrix sp. BB-4]
MISDVLFLTARLGISLAVFAFLSQTWDAATQSWSACANDAQSTASSPADVVQSLQQLTRHLPFIPAQLQQADDGQPVSSTCSHS